MQKRPLGPSGIDASVIGFGAWAIGGWMWGGADRADAVRAIHAAIDAGVTLVDTAPVYGFGTSEDIVGEAIHDRRDQVVLATKCGLVWHTQQGDFYFKSDARSVRGDSEQFTVHRFLGPKSLRYELEQSLKRLRTDHIDLYQTHWQETTTPIADTMGELLRMKDEGKIRAIGVSNVSTAQLDAYRACGPVDADQESYSMLDRAREKTLLPYCADHGLAFLAYSPMARGLLTGKMGPEREFNEGDQRRNNPQFSVENRRKVAAMLDAMRPVAERNGLTILQLVLAWTLHQRGCSHALVGARTPAQVLENAKAGEARLGAADLAEVQKAVEAKE
jgi:aryl-alcohol dehydrogenase-like predicted oxidoreductase